MLRYAENGYWCLLFSRNRIGNKSFFSSFDGFIDQIRNRVHISNRSKSNKFNMLSMKFDFVSMLLYYSIVIRPFLPVATTRTLDRYSATRSTSLGPTLLREFKGKL